jgi:phytoene dehydrogenase-like protein
LGGPTGRAAVVGSGPNGLTAAVTLARAGFRVEVFEAASSIGGGTRTSELTVPGVLHDHCSAFHPAGVASPAFAALATDLARHGLVWRWPDIAFAHPLPDGSAGAVHRSVDDTAAGLGTDGPAWRRLFGPLTEHYDALVADTFRPILHVPRHPVHLARFGLLGLRPATGVARRWSTPLGRALFGGVAAHAIHPLTRPTTAAVGLMLTAAAHAHGWPVAEGGSRAITDALAGILAEAGGIVTTDTPIGRLDEVGPADVVMLDVAPAAAASIVGDALPRRVARAYRRYRYGPAAFKVDFAVEGGVPWTAEACERAGTVHVVGTFEETVAAEAAVHAGRVPERPFVLVGQQYLADPSRSADDVHPVWAYCHVPHGWTGDATAAIIAQIERFAPGFTGRVVATATRSPAEFAAYDANFVGGDIATGAADPVQLLFRPRVARDPYATGVPGVWLCSAATPPGAGVHGMGGYHAARRAIRASR